MRHYDSLSTLNVSILGDKAGSDGWFSFFTETDILFWDLVQVIAWLDKYVVLWICIWTTPLENDNYGSMAKICMWESFSSQIRKTLIIARNVPASGTRDSNPLIVKYVHMSV